MVWMEAVSALIAEFNSREWAIMAWLAILFTYGISKTAVRKSLLNVLRIALSPKLLAIWAVYLAWIAGFVAIFHRLGSWKIPLIKDTIVWTVTSGVVLLSNFPDAWRPGYFRRAVLKAVGVVAIIEYLVTLSTFPFWAEFMLQPIIALFAAAPLLIKEPKPHAAWQRISTWFFAVLGCAMIVHTILSLRGSWSTTDWNLVELRAMLPMALALWVLIVVFGLAVMATYEQAFLRLHWSRDTEVGIWRPKLGLVLALRLRLRWIRDAAKGGTVHVAQADSVKTCFQAAKSFKEERIRVKRREDAYRANLTLYTGSTELDENGRPCDKREFRETIHALEWLHTCQMGWYRREPVGYKPNVLEILGDDFTAQGLPAPSGIKMMVSGDGQRWHAYRRTPSGYHFAVGASELPPSQWFYEGPNPPLNFPDAGLGWSNEPFIVELGTGSGLYDCIL